MRLSGTRVVIRPMVRTDLDAMVHWRPFADPLYQPFDYPLRSELETDEWFDGRARDPSRRLFVVEDKGRRVIGSLTLRGIRGQHSARLGITLGADFVSQGYGTEALRLFLEYYFGTMGFDQMELDVAATNLRAIRCYQSLGFRRVGHQYRTEDHPSYAIVRHDAHYRHLRRFFRQRGPVYEVLFYDMVLTRSDWLDEREQRPVGDSVRTDTREGGLRPLS